MSRNDFRIINKNIVRQTFWAFYLSMFYTSFDVFDVPVPRGDWREKKRRRSASYRDGVCQNREHKMSFNRSRSELFYLSGLESIPSKFLSISWIGFWECRKKTSKLLSNACTHVISTYTSDKVFCVWKASPSEISSQKRGIVSCQRDVNNNWPPENFGQPFVVIKKFDKPTQYLLLILFYWFHSMADLLLGFVSSSH